MMKHTEIPADAPAFDPGRSDYPLGGAKTGPIWRAAWDALRMPRRAGQEYVPGASLVAFVANNVPDAHPETVRLILSRAAKAGILESELRPVRGARGVRNVAHYRIKR